MTTSTNNPLDAFGAEALRRAKETGKDHCRFCKSKLGLPVHEYPHEGGWSVPGWVGRFWLYLICSGCGYAWALWKLGLPRDWAPEAPDEAPS